MKKVTEIRIDGGNAWLELSKDIDGNTILKGKHGQIPVRIQQTGNRLRRIPSTGSSDGYRAQIDLLALPWYDYEGQGTTKRGWIREVKTF